MMPSPQPSSATPVTHVLYLHGFLSSPSSTKARMTAAAMAQHHAEVVWLCPMLAASPAQALQEVLQATADWPKASTAVIGSSLGGFYATWLAERWGCRAVMLNPAVRPARDLATHVGEHTLWHDSDTHFVLEPRYIDELKAMELPHISHPERYFAVIAKGDEVLDWREMHSHYTGASIKLLSEGDHGLSDYDQHLDEVLGFLRLT
ncbi:MAG TPA: YqiA/YcfP family alpha/beta fold hydrolase [Rhodoferax sp.]